MIKEIYTLYVERWHFFLDLTWEHLQISLMSIVIATMVGLGLGIMISMYRKSSSTVLGLTNFIYTIPSIALFGFLIPFSGIGNTTAIIALSIYALLPMVHNTYTGIIGIDKEIIEAARGMGSTTFQIFPVILSGIRNMVVMTIALTGIAAFIGAGGLGVAIYRGITTNNSAMTIAGSLLIALLALLADWGVGRYEKHIKRKRKLL